MSVVGAGAPPVRRMRCSGQARRELTLSIFDLLYE